MEGNNLLGDSSFDASKDNQNITPTEEEYNGEFGAKKSMSVWDTDDEE